MHRFNENNNLDYLKIGKSWCGMNMTVEDAVEFRKIIKSEIETIEKHMDEKIDAGFKLLNETISHNYDRTLEQIKTRVSDVTCQNHREKILDEKGRLSDRIIVLETQKRSIAWAVAFLIPVALIGLVYGILMYQKVEDLRIIINKNPPITKDINI